MENDVKVNIDDLTVKIEDKDYLANISGDYPFVYRLHGQLFSGIVVANHKNGYEEFAVINGIENGFFFSLYPDGQKKYEGIHKNTHEIEKTEWDRNGRIIVQFTENFYRKWSSDGVLLVENDYVNLIDKDFYPTGELKKITLTEPYTDIDDITCHIALEEQYFAENGDLLFTRYADKRAPKNAVHKYNWRFTFEDSALKKHFEVICNITDTFFLVNIAAWLKHLLDIDKKTGIEYLRKMIEHQNLCAKHEALFVAEGYKVKEVLPSIKDVLSINEYPPHGQMMSYGFTISQLAERVIKRIKNPFARKEKD